MSKPLWLLGLPACFPPSPAQRRAPLRQPVSFDGSAPWKAWRPEGLRGRLPKEEAHLNPQTA
eukprot:15480313-Alexandrium_andersonii.AAC.1